MREIRKTEQKRTPSKQRKGVNRDNREKGRMQRQQKNVAMEAFWRER